MATSTTADLDTLALTTSFELNGSMGPRSNKSIPSYEGPGGTLEDACNDSDRVTSIDLDDLEVANLTYDSYTGRVLTYSHPSGSGNDANGTLSKGIDTSRATQWLDSWRW